MKILICATKSEVGKEAAGLVLNELRRKKNLVLGLATGKTMIPFYRELTRMSKAKKASYANVKTFNLDEYAGVSSRDKKSLRYFMERNFFDAKILDKPRTSVRGESWTQENFYKFSVQKIPRAKRNFHASKNPKQGFFDKVNLKKENIYFLDGKAFDLKKECLNYESKIRRAGGIDLQILGVGRNGHIGFNEPGSSLKSMTRVVKLSDMTMKDNDGVPKSAVTMGVDTIMKAKKIIVLATGKKKARILLRVIAGRIGKNVPASFLQKHRDVIFILDKAAASELSKLHKKI